MPVPQFHLLQDKIDESSKGHFLCCETKLVNSRKKLSIVIFQKKGWPLKCQHYSDPQNKIASSITLFWPPGGRSLAQLAAWLWLTSVFAAKKKRESRNMAEAGNVVHEDDRKLFVGALPQVDAHKTMIPNSCQMHLVRSCIFIVKLQPLNGAIEIIAFSRRPECLCLVVDKV